MNNLNEIETQYFSDKFNNLLKDLEPNHVIMVKYLGELSQESIARLEGEVESSVIQNAIAKGPLKKIFFISVETLQNMLIHGQKNDAGVQKNFFILSKNHTKVNITSANLVKNEAVEALSSQINKINSFDDQASLKQFYMDHLENNQISEKGGAGLGFITIAMKSGNKLKVDFEKIDDQYSLFLLTSSVGIES